MPENAFDHSKIYNLKESVTYAGDSVVSKILRKNDGGNLTLFAFDRGQNLSEHTAPYDAVVEVIEGKAKILIDKEEHLLEAGDFMIMPAHIPHALEAVTRFKMLLVMVRGS